MGDRGETADFDRMVAELQRQIVEQERALYSAKVIEEAHNPRNLGRMPEPDTYGLVQWMSLHEAGKVRPEDLVTALDGLPEESIHCAELAVSTLREAIANRRAEGSA